MSGCQDVRMSECWDTWTLGQDKREERRRHNGVAGKGIEIISRYRAHKLVHATRMNGINM
jgi:hypothetical protein